MIDQIKSEITALHAQIQALNQERATLTTNNMVAGEHDSVT
ncbi:MAG: hypothetical protein ACFKPT_19245 [Gloeotrichia echinulata GP01]